MTRLNYLLLVFSVLISGKLFSNAIAIVDATDKTVLQLVSSHVEVEIVNQVSTVVTTQKFYNNLGEKVHLKYAFPMYEDAAATSLRWKVNGVWYQASFAAEPADTTLPGGEATDPDLETYLGETPLFFDLIDSLDADSTIIFELTYVQLLHYAYNTVSFNFPNNYSLISTASVDSQTLYIHMISDRTVVGTSMLSHVPDINTFTSGSSEVYVELINSEADADYAYTYDLDPAELGLFSFSTYLPDSVSICDNFGRGYFSFIVEPDPGDSVIIQKVFTLIIDKSGSMSGEKMEQAIDAANFIVDNLNDGDKFNIIDFDSDVHELFADHMPVSIANQNAAHSYINAITAGGSTNISGSFSMAIPEFSGADPDIANIIIFLTDGQASAGITTTDGILNLISDQIADYDVEGLSINCFGIGYDVNEALLSQIATENDGIYESFAAGDLLTVISEFYLSIQNPVLLNTEMTFDPPIVHEVYPDPLANLYKGHQLIVTGRYVEPGTVTVNFSGEKYGEIITYTYSFELTDSSIDQNLFLTKLWAIEKINNLMSEYFTYGYGTAESDSIKELVTGISICYSVVSPFTSFTDDTGGYGGLEIEIAAAAKSEFRLHNYPNPFRDQTKIICSTGKDIHELVACTILDLRGNIIRIVSVYLGAAGTYEIVWDGLSETGDAVQPGLYPYYITIGDEQYYGIMEKF